MKYIIFDMEWNQPYSKVKKESGGVALKGEIIQIGAVRLGEDFVAESVFEENVRPVFYRRINKHVRDITGLDNSMLADCDTFSDVMARFLEFCTDEYVLLAWGTDDMPMLRDNMLAHGMDISGLPECYNLQVIFNKQVSHESRQWSLEDAMESLDIEQDYVPHNALADAVNTAKVAVRLDLVKGIDEYADNLGCKTVRTERIDGYNDFAAALRDPRLNRQVCPICNKKLTPARWVGNRGKRFAVTECKVHGPFKFTLSVFAVEKTVSAKLRVCYADAQDVDVYNERLEAARAKKLAAVK